jgi:hypothetical protein
VDGTLVPVHDREVAASSKNYRYSVNMQVVIDADTRLAVAVGDPLPGNRNDCRAFTESGIDQACDGGSRTVLRNCRRKGRAVYYATAQSRSCATL